MTERKVGHRLTRLGEMGDAFALVRDESRAARYFYGMWGRCALLFARLGFAQEKAWRVQVYRTPPSEDPLSMRKVGAKFTHLPTASQWGVVSTGTSPYAICRRSPAALRLQVIDSFAALDMVPA